jgi:hypothetical protein
MKYKIQRRHYSGTEEFILNVPSDLKFCKIYELNENQQIWMCIFPYNKKLVSKLNSLSTRDYRLGELSIVILSDIKPLDVLNEISYEQLCDEFNPIISKYFIKRITRDGKLLSILKIISLDGYSFKCAELSINSHFYDEPLDMITYESHEINHILSPEPGEAITSSGFRNHPFKGEDIEMEYQNRLTEIYNLVKIN